MYSTANRDPKIKSDGTNTYHRDGTVSYWSVYNQVWERQDAADISDKELAAMNASERARIARMVANA